MEWRNIQKGKDTYLPIFESAKSIIVFDTETTGLGRDAKIIEFAAIRYEISPTGMRETHKVDLYLNPEEPLKEKIIEITGITDAILEKARPERVEAEEIYNFLSGADVWAAYNCSFDIRMLNQMSDRTGIPYEPRTCVDVLEMARDLVPKEESGSHKLGDICTVLFPEKTFQFHTAIDDVRATALLMSRFVGMYKNYSGESKKRQCRLNWASYWINPRKPSQVRIKLNLSEGEYGDIFWDVVQKTWSCKSASKNCFPR